MDGSTLSSSSSNPNKDIHILPGSEGTVMLNGRARINQIELDDNTISALDSNLVLQTAVGQ